MVGISFSRANYDSSIFFRGGMCDYARISLRQSSTIPLHNSCGRCELDRGSD